jgi:integrase
VIASQPSSPPVKRTTDYGILAPSSKKNRNIAFKAIGELGLGDLGVALCRRKQLADIVDAMAQTKPGAARDLLSAFHAIYKQAILAELVEADPLAGYPRPVLHNAGGHYSWEEADIAKYRRHHRLGTTARLALEIFLYTALRCSDACRVGPGTGTLTGDGRIRLVQRKLQRFGERAEVFIPIHPDLKAALDAMPVVGQKTWLITQTGNSFSNDYLSGTFAQWCKAAGLPEKCRAHGLRKACAKRLIDAGVSPADAAAITGHMDLKQLMFYAAARDRRLGAERAIAALGR